MIRSASDDQRIVITGIGLTAPNGDNLADYRAALLAGKSGVEPYNIRYIGDTLAGVCHFNELKHQNRKDVRRGTRAGSVSIYCAREAVADSGIRVTACRKTSRPSICSHCWPCSSWAAEMRGWYIEPGASTHSFSA